jgi:hypothetical protein
MVTKIDDKALKTFDEIEKLYPDNFILVLEANEGAGIVVGLSSGSEVALADYSMLLFEAMNPKPKHNPYVIAYGANVDSSIGGVFLED